MKASFVTSLLVIAQTALAGNFTRYVNPFIGTGAVENSLSGNCYPGATTPFGAVQLSPDTREQPYFDCASGYDYNDKLIYGFSHTRISGTGVIDLIDLLVMPTNKPGTDRPQSPFSHEREEAHPGYYSVMLDDTGIRAELTATTRTGIHRYTFPKGKPQRLYVDLEHSGLKGDFGRRILHSQLRLVSPTVIEGYRVITGWARIRRIYFHMELSRPVTAHELIDGGRHDKRSPMVNGQELRGFFDLAEDGQDELLCKLSVSSTSVENARENMRAEASGWDFNAYAEAADRQWDDMLGCLEVEGSEHNKEMLYTALYHTMIQPNILSDANGDYTATDYSTQRMPEGKPYYTTFSLWDTFRAAHPLYTLLQPQKDAEFVNSMLVHYDRYGYLPVWDLYGQDNYCMIGNHAVPVVVDACLKGLPGIDQQHALEACVASCTYSHPANSNFEAWKQYGYIPENVVSQSVSITLEQAFDDWCVAQLARKLGKEDIYQRFIKSSQNYRHLFNPANGFFQAKDSEGKWIEPFDPLRYGGNGGAPYTEGNAWQWNWYVPQDISGLIELMGGDQKFTERLDSFFTITASSGERNSNASGFIGQYVHGNEPSHHVAYLYNYAGKPRSAQKYIWQVMNELYNTTSSGYAGNDDCGEMSAWFVFSAMGFYPVNPVGGDFSIGTPLFDSVKMHLPNGRTFTVKARRRDGGHYVKSVRLNGRKLKDYTLRYADIMDGSTLEFDLGK